MEGVEQALADDAGLTTAARHRRDAVDQHEPGGVERRDRHRRLRAKRSYGYAKLAQQAGLARSRRLPAEVQRSSGCGASFQTVTPGIRPAGADIGDQSRIMTPREALEARDGLYGDRPSDYGCRRSESNAWNP